MPRLEHLVRAVHDAPASLQEQPFVEWKSEGDASEKKWRAELARQVLGMANRDPGAAAPWFGGCAYVLLGVAPGVLNGTPVYDSAKLESWLSPYVGRAPEGPDWIGTYVELEDKHVLVLTIEPPEAGDPIWTCRREFLADPKAPGRGPSVALREGAVYIRRGSRTEEAGAADLAMLQRRLLASSRRLNGVSVLLSATSQGQAIDATDETIAAWIECERKACEPPPPQPATRPVRIKDLPDPDSALAQTAKLIVEMGQSALSAGFAADLVKPDTRTRQDYDAQVETYLGKAREALPGVILKRAHDKRLGFVAFSVRNETEQPIQSLLLEVVIEMAGVWAVGEWDSDLDKAELPARPIMLGKDTRSPLDRIGYVSAPLLSRSWLDIPSLPSRGPRVSIDNSGSTRLTFDDIDLYPEETVLLPDVFLYANANAHAGQTLTAQWSARARNLTGVTRGSLEIPVASTVPTINELLAKEDGHDDEDPG
jgi:hypothetical protein